jgi:extracellular elastinolytic metalloproteinase
MSYRYSTLLAAFLFAAIPLFSQNNDFSKWLPLLEERAGQLGVAPMEIKNASVNRLYTDEKTQITYIYLQQRYQQVKVLDAVLSIAVKGDRILYSSGRFIKPPVENGQALRLKTVVQPLEAVRKAAEHLKLRVGPNLRISSDRFGTEKKYTVAAADMARRDVKVEQYWQASVDHKQLKLVWNVGIDDLYSDNYWQVRVDAADGSIAGKRNLTVYEKEQDSMQRSETPVYWPSAASQPASRSIAAPISTMYTVIPYPGRDAQWGMVHPVFDPWTVFGPANPATTLGWQSTADTDYNITRGNNVFAYMGTNPTDLPDPVYNWPDTAVVDGSQLFFEATPDNTTAPYDSVNRRNKKFGLVNLFYWSNMIHDFSYQYGFTEAAGNYQASNLGRGGEEGDPILAQSQDGHGINNANFSPAEDGVSGRIRTYIWQNTYLQVSRNGVYEEFEARQNRFDAPNKLVNLQDVDGQLVNYFNNPTSQTGCLPDNDLAGKIAIIPEQNCCGCAGLNMRALNAQNAGAIGVIFYSYDQIITTPIGNAPTVTIPVIGVNRSVGDDLINRLAAGEPVFVKMVARDRDVSLDNSIIIHEYMHGISLRLTGGGESGSLSNWEQAGEGWSDYLALMMTTDWDNPFYNGVNPSPVAVYSDDDALGIRRYPYSTDMSVNPLTYADMSISPYAHPIGEIWCSAIWDMTWDIIAQKGSSNAGFLDNTGNSGNSIALNLVMTGLKLQPYQPGFLDARDAILAADSILYNGEFHCTIWRAFARRGMGYNARQGLADIVGDEVADFSLPLMLVGIKDTAIQTGSQFKVTHKIKSSCLPITGYILRDTIPSGFSYVSSTPAGLLQPGGVVMFPYIDLAAGEEKTFTITLQSFAPTCKADTVIHDNRDGKSLGNFTTNIQQGESAGWSVVAGGKSGQAWSAPDNNDWSMINLVSDPTALSPGRTLSLLSFNHRYNVDPSYDGGVVEYSTDGMNWNDLGPYFIQNGYNGLGVRWFNETKIFTANSMGYRHSVADLTPLGTTPVRIRFRFGNDGPEGGGGWQIDDIMRVNYCAAMLRTGLYNSQNSQLASSAVTTLYLGDMPAALPLTLVSFEAREDGSANRLQWKTESEVNVQQFEIEFSKDGAQWTTIGTVPARNLSVNQYSYTHTDPVNGVNYYRLKMKDMDGKFKYSNTEVVRRQSSEKYFTLQPNPAQGTAHFYFSGSLRLSSIRIYDASGRLVKQVAVNPGSTQYELSLNGIANGVYVAEAIGHTGKELIRFAVQN